MIASAARSASSSVVLQFETEIRRAVVPCHLVPLAHAVPSCWTAAAIARVPRIAARGIAAGVVESDEDLVEDHVG